MSSSAESKSYTLPLTCSNCFTSASTLFCPKLDKSFSLLSDLTVPCFSLYQVQHNATCPDLHAHV
ncbi:uncharacterized protein EKO05_0006790 [Ascochyta rabiei]|uniref:uncharacterized protein n=1 Tax=Didymella rabiei TaxID=5454 RepID=UPI0021FA4959|nr:uncharacterized protein EKO05_0006790 [Ascochyta rabiei]UPX16384.1 hypothetical protein EKO05_0006790 [Ascochyta rabiei]